MTDINEIIEILISFDNETGCIEDEDFPDVAKAIIDKIKEKEKDSYTMGYEDCIKDNAERLRD